MKQIIDQLGNIEFDHSRWLNEIIFSSKEIELYQRRLMEIVDEYSNEEKTAELSALFDDFDKQKQIANDLKLRIKKHVVSNSKLVRSNGDLKAMINSDHRQTRQEMDNFRNQFAKLKESFHGFSALQD